MHTVTSFHASAVEPHQIDAMLTEYLALERARLYRRLSVTRFSLLALLVAVIGFHLDWLPHSASFVSIGLCALAPVWAWVAELRCDWRLAQRLKDVPGVTTRVVSPPRS
jgi:hypothetical protein